jgi:hypothetical protein
MMRQRVSVSELTEALRYLPQWYYYYGGLADKIEGSVWIYHARVTYAFSVKLFATGKVPGPPEPEGKLGLPMIPMCADLTGGFGNLSAMTTGLRCGLRHATQPVVVRFAGL